ncbi:MAG: long-chain fatty acid--CoA ligase, partial [Rhodospirillaceae bacterium]
MTVRDTANLGDIFHRDHGAAGPSARLVLTDCRDWDAPREWTQVKLEAAADACGRGLLGTGLKPGDAVVMLSANSAQFLVAFLGILRAGLVAVPINHKFPPDTVAFIMGDAAAKAIICDGSRRERVDALATGLPVFDFDDGSFDAMCDPGPLDIYDAGADGIAMVLYTSGSTGRPKGVALTHAGHVWAHNYRVAKAGNQTGERFLVAAPLYHMNALCTTLFAFGVDAEVVLLPEFTTHSYIDAISRFKCSMLTCVPPMLAMCLAEPGLIENADLSSVRSVRMGSAPVSANLWARVSAAFPGAQLTNVYGTTEAGPVVFGPRPGKVAPQSSVGWPADGVDLRLVGRDGKDAEEGELWQRTPAAMAGYLNLPEKTTEVFSE